MTQYYSVVENDKIIKEGLTLEKAQKLVQEKKKERVLVLEEDNDILKKLL